jgi:hypothetical protein
MRYLRWVLALGLSTVGCAVEYGGEDVESSTGRADTAAVKNCDRTNQWGERPGRYRGKGKCSDGLYASTALSREGERLRATVSYATPRPKQVPFWIAHEPAVVGMGVPDRVEVQIKRSDAIEAKDFERRYGFYLAHYPHSPLRDQSDNTDGTTHRQELRFEELEFEAIDASVVRVVFERASGGSHDHGSPSGPWKLIVTGTGNDRVMIREMQITFERSAAGQHARNADRR